ncbi:molybdenum cofactor guanylyltransferase MobA [Izhakiella australiensis]|uniref:Molybdenum cofactor guanylyltransferase n=1 Tax=Izhakiella australiensis TaxID=1926881 RepID=A0A1S8YCW5_9GAMM|nr:molybdenum cofactor guanylyltransferase MobA [Izhakiella australiensis]OON36961.1 molybdenum cofactor guanylyltransferase MobA [Izhakiella australiensis]
MRSDILPITGALLAGGQGSRMGGKDKGLLLLQDIPLYQHVLRNLQPQFDSVVINANRNIDRYAESGLPVITDSLHGFPGPLAGMLAVLSVVTTPWVAFAPCDTPWLPIDWAGRLWRQKGAAPAVWVKSRERDHPALAILSTALCPDLQVYLAGGKRRLMQFLTEAGGHGVLLEDEERCFANINTPADLPEG